MRKSLRSAEKALQAARSALDTLALAYRIAAHDAPWQPAAHPDWQQRHLPAACGDCLTEQTELEPGLRLVRSRYLPARDLCEASANDDGPRTLVMTFGLHGDSGYLEDGGGALPFRAGHTTIAAFRASRGQRRYRAGHRVTQLRLLMQEDWLIRHGSEAAMTSLSECGVRQIALMPTTASSAAHVAALACTRAHQPGSRLALRSHALGLLAEQLRPFLAETSPTAPPPSRDADRLDAAVAHMRSRLDQPLTIAALAAASGLSETRLKDGFRREFGTTPNAMLLAFRMRHAHALLGAGNAVAQTAWQVGYAHPANFSTAFTRFFGYGPKAVRAGRT